MPKRSYCLKAMQILEDDPYTDVGICVECGETQGGVEPDASDYICESCGSSSVYGCEEIAIRGL